MGVQAEGAAGVGGTAPIDAHGRVATDLRVSFTDRCGPRCTYCTPEEGLRRLSRRDVPTDDELVRLVRVAVTDPGLRQVRSLSRTVLLVSGRLSSELARKAVMAGVPRLAAVSVPPSLAVGPATGTGPTPVGPLLGASTDVYAGEQRVERQASAGRPRRPEGGLAR